MRDGLAFLASDAQARQAFRLANRSILIQQVRSRREARAASFDTASGTLFFEEQYGQLDLDSPGAARLATGARFKSPSFSPSLRSTADRRSPERDLVELIWFPTGGGKTEAYLGLAAFSIFLRRLRNPSDTGVQALMRYTFAC